MSALLETIRALIRDELKTLRLGDIAIVTSVFPHEEGDDNNYEVSVKLRESDLELRQVPMCTPHIGMVSAPAVGELVLVTYVGGDANRPIVVGRLYSDEHPPPAHKEKAWVVESPLKGPARLTLTEEGDVVAVAGKTTLTLKKDGDVEITGEAALTITVKGDASVKADGAVTLEAGGDATVKAGGDATVKAGGNVTIKGSKVEIN